MREKSCRRTNRVCFTTTWESGSSCLRRTSLYQNYLLFHLILLRVKFLFSSRFNESFSEAVLKFWKPRRGSWRQSRGNSLLNPSSSKLKHRKEVWKTSLLFGIKMNCSWHQSCYFSDRTGRFFRYLRLKPLCGYVCVTIHRCRYALKKCSVYPHTSEFTYYYR